MILKLDRASSMRFYLWETNIFGCAFDLCVVMDNDAIVKHGDISFFDENTVFVKYRSGI
jgi:hypothetical protein